MHFSWPLAGFSDGGRKGYLTNYAMHLPIFLQANTVNQYHDLCFKYSAAKATARQICAVAQKSPTLPPFIRAFMYTLR